MEVNTNSTNSGSYAWVWIRTEYSDKDVWYIRYPDVIRKGKALGRDADLPYEVILARFNDVISRFDVGDLYFSEQKAQKALDIIHIIHIMES